MLEIMHQMHMDFLGKAIEKPRRLNHLSTEPCSVEFFRKSNNLKDLLNLETKGKICELGSF